MMTKYFIRQNKITVVNILTGSCELRGAQIGSCKNHKH